MPARGAVGDDQRGWLGVADSRQQRKLGHVHRSLIGLSAVAEGAGHAATAGFDGFDIQIRNKPQCLLDRSEGAEGFLMAMAVHQGFPGDRAERQPQAAGRGLAHQELLEQQRLRADGFCGLVGAQ